MSADLGKLRELLAGTTPGEWKREALGGCSTIIAKEPSFAHGARAVAYGYKEDRGYCIAVPFHVERTRDEEAYYRTDFVSFSHGDAEFLVAAKNSLPALLDTIEALEAARRAFLGCAYPVATEINPRGHNWRSENALDYALEVARAATLAGEPDER